MELREIRSFVAVAKYLSFSKAADELFISPSSVSKYISALERNVHHQLFLRNTHRVVLTDFGRAFYPYARELLKKDQELSDFLQNYQEGTENRKFRLAVDISLSSVQSDSLLLRLVNATNRFNRIHSESIQCEMSFVDGKSIFKQLHNHEADIIISSSSRSRLDSAVADSLEYDCLEENINYLIYSPVLNECDGSDGVRNLVNNYSNIIFMTDTTPQCVTLELIRQLEVTPRLQPCQNWSDFLMYVTAGEGVGIIPDTIAFIAEECEMDLISLESYGIHSGLYAFWRKGYDLEIVEKFISHLHETLPKNR